MSLEKWDFRRVGILSVVLILVLGGDGCCVGIVTKVRSKTGREISLTVIKANQNPAAPVTIPAGSSRICSGVIVGDTGVSVPADTTWIVSDGKSKFVFDDVAPIGTMRGRSRTESRFTSMFPCNRVTQHVELETNMVIHAVGGVGQEIPQPAGFPIHYTSTNANLEYDKVHYDQMRQMIGSSKNKLPGVSLEQATKLLSLENVKWDEGYTSVPRGQLRVYHFHGFYLLLSLQVFPRGITPDSHGQFSVNDPELRTNGVWWVANFDPALHIDGIDDPKERMSNYWEQVHAGFEKRTEEMNKK